VNGVPVSRASDFYEAEIEAQLARNIAVADEPQRALPRTLAVALWAVAGAIVAGWLSLAALHIHDDYRIGHTQGVWIAAAESARAGRMYAPLFDGEHYAGTRYMPLPILLEALASSAIGNPLIGGKLLAALLMTALLALVMVLLVGFSCPLPMAAALATVVVATEAGLYAGTTIGGDSLPVVLQLAALTVALRSQTRRTSAMLIVAGVLAGLAIASKLTGFWGALAILTWLVARRQWRPAGTFAIACVGTAAVILGTVQVVTGGGLLQHLLAFSFAGVKGPSSALRAPNQVLYQLRTYATGAVVLMPLAALAALSSTDRWRPSLVYLALAYAMVVLLVVYTDLGTGFNQLLDVICLIALAVGHLAGRAARDPDARHRQFVTLAVALTIIWAAGIDLVRTVGFDLRGAVADVVTGKPATRGAEIVASMVRPGEQVLTEDPAIDVALGRQPLVMDPFMVTRLDRSHPELVDPLIGWIKNRRFDLIVLVAPLDNGELENWWSDYHFGPRVADAVRSSYRYDRRVGRFRLYRPVR
jgi:hypothetical protein